MQQGILHSASPSHGAFSATQSPTYGDLKGSSLGGILLLNFLSPSILSSEIVGQYSIIPQHKIFTRKMALPRTATQSGDDNLRAVPIKPTRTFHIVPHRSLTKTIKVLDITNQVTAAYGTKDFEDQAKQGAKTSPPNACLTVTRSPHWYSNQFIVKSPTEQGQVAEWKGGLLSSSASYLSFPPESPHSAHDITVGVKGFWKFKEQFVKDSIAYIWQPDNVLTMRQFTLWKLIGQDKVEVGRYWQGYQPFATGGTLVLNTNEVDDVVGILTCIVVLRKKRHRDGESRNLAAG